MLLSAFQRPPEEEKQDVTSRPVAAEEARLAAATAVPPQRLRGFTLEQCFPDTLCLASASMLKW